ncbi:hypothetical protein C0W52_18280 [Photobacterium kishitanii]|uniref:Uncharacterized protein n=1 Tax=Photobacterium kishitanii TaxID=318456 RepID=A0AAX0YS36_9GAMM|nr:hypothetical protein CTM84_10900 [Photobacterium kishitanii]PSU21059.1 hypothetical protein CTM84_10910 [Photobacterium kishitanii]PSX19693.1 hypothetical protein C0W70_09530 [Photobacterium kishitanii]PSX26592.1 hypothetical protein C0W52_18280 [Photobacterium kishitanii]PSX33443.1 hypothetical protein C0W39_09545 [Photobacterium kishitanii]
MVITTWPLAVSPSLSVAVTPKLILAISAAFWSIEPVTSTVYEPSVAIVTTITGLSWLSTTVSTLPATVKVVASPLLVIPSRPGCSALKSI